MHLGKGGEEEWPDRERRRGERRDGRGMKRRGTDRGRKGERQADTRGVGWK